MKKKSPFYIILFAIVVIALAGNIFIPENGTFTLLNEVFESLLLVAVIAMLIRALITLVKSKKIANILLVSALILIISAVAGGKSINTIKDFIIGPEWIRISNCEVEKRGTSRGIFSLNYYLKGEDMHGESYRFGLSGKEYEALKSADEISVLCYKNTRRIVDLKR